MTNSPLTAPAAHSSVAFCPAAAAASFLPPTPAAPAVVPGLGQTGVDLTVVLPMYGSASAVRTVVERLSEALYAQCISFEVVGLADADTLAADEVNGLPLTRFVRADGDAPLPSGSPVASGSWVAVLDVDSAAEIDAYGFVELLHQARERSAALV